ncbi:hypothetical protein DIPPA_27614 [Diplonema papillatum]|nr:hypothetical protein DIPPA_27614 [Diplonema papillatum]
MKPEAVMARNEMLARKEAERIKKEVAAQLQKASLVPAQPSPTALRADRIQAQLQKETSSRVVPTTSLPSRPSVTVKQPRPPPSASEELENLLRAAGSLPEHAGQTAKQKEQRDKLLKQFQLSSALSQQLSKTLA